MRNLRSRLFITFLFGVALLPISPLHAEEQEIKGILIFSKYTGGTAVIQPFTEISLETAAIGHITTPAGNRQEFRSRYVHHVIYLDGEYLDSLRADAKYQPLRSFILTNEFTPSWEPDNIQTAEDRQQLEARKETIAELSKKYPSIAPQLEATIPTLDSILERYDSGARKKDGYWNQTVATPSPKQQNDSTDSEKSGEHFSFTTKKGKAYRDVYITEVDKDQVSLMLPDGIQRIPVDSLPGDISSFPEPWNSTIAELRGKATMAKAQQLENDGDLKQALAIYESNKSSRDIHRIKAQLAEQKRDYKEALSHAKAINDQALSERYMTLMQAKQAEASGEWKSAKDLYQEGKATADAKRMQANLDGAAAESAGKPYEAIEHYEIGGATEAIKRVRASIAEQGKEITETLESNMGGS